MKTHTIKTPTSELLVVQLPKGQKVAFGYYSDQLTIFDHEKDFRDSEINFEGNWEILGKPDEISEEEAELLVETTIAFRIDGIDYLMWKHYAAEYDYLLTAKESLLSLLESQIFWKNPQEWHETEQKTFDRTRTIIFKKLIR